MAVSPSLAGKKRVVFQIAGAKGSDVYVAGTFNDWNARKNKLVYKNGVYTTSILVPKGRLEYKFVVNGVWCVDPKSEEYAPNGLGGLNSVMTVS